MHPARGTWSMRCNWDRQPLPFQTDSSGEICAKGEIEKSTREGNMVYSIVTCHLRELGEVLIQAIFQEQEGTNPRGKVFGACNAPG